LTVGASGNFSGVRSGVVGDEPECRDSHCGTARSRNASTRSASWKNASAAPSSPHFGGGDRICIGNHFGGFEVKIVLAVLLSRGCFTLLDQGTLRVARRGFLMGPSRVPVRFQAR
jgi:hypothetical protein